MEGQGKAFGITSSVLCERGQRRHRTVLNACLYSFMRWAEPCRFFDAFDEAVFAGGFRTVHMLIIVIVTVFVAGLLAGRKPDTWARKSRFFEIKCCPGDVNAASCIAGGARGDDARRRKGGPLPGGAQALSNIYVHLGSQHDGSSMPSLGNTPFTTCPGHNDVAGSFLVILPVLALAGEWQN
jgi:K+-transporting ATPase A subunit